MGKDERYDVVCMACGRWQPSIHVDNDHYSTELKICHERCCYCKKGGLEIKKR